MHVRRGIWGHVVAAIAIVTFALPLTAITTSTITSAQVPSNQTTFTGSLAGVGSVTAANPISSNPSISIDPVGDTETFTFTCMVPDSGNYAISIQSPALTDPTGAGCYNVTISAQNASQNAQVPLQGSNCWGIANNANTTYNTYSIGSENGGVGECDYIFPQGDTTSPGVAFSTAAGTIMETAPDSFVVSFSGYVPAVCPSGFAFPQQGTEPTSVTDACLGSNGTTSAVCPANTGPTAVWEPSESGYAGPHGANTSGAYGAFCQFTVSGQKKYVEVNAVTLTQTVPSSGACGFTLTYAEGLKSYFGPSCTFVATATGETVIKFGEDCSTTNFTADETMPAAEFGAGAHYVCSAGALLVEGIPVPNVSLTFTSTAGGFNSGNTLTTGNGTLCTAASGSTSFTTTTGATGTATAVLCPSGPVSGTVKACTTGGTLNQQPGGICSSTIPFAFTITSSRVVPQVRWAGEKIALTKCFGVGMAYDDVEFTLQSTGAPLNATLIPASEYGLGTGGGSSYGGLYPAANTVWVAADQQGCATVIGYAQGEGQMLVDAAVFASGSGQGAGTANTATCTSTYADGATYECGPLINEHAFEVFYLKYERVDLENLTPSTYSTATGFKPYYTSFLAGTASFHGASTFPTSFPQNEFGGFPNAPGTGDVAGATGYQVPLCQTQFIRAMVHGYFEMAGDPSGRPAATVAIPNAPAGSAGSYVLPAGRWVLPEDWPLLATFAGVSPVGTGTDATPSSYYAWDLNSGYVFNPAGEAPVLCESQNVATPGAFAPPAVVSGNGPISNYDTGPCYGSFDGSFGSGTTYTSAPNGTDCSGQTVGIGPFDPTQSCLDVYPPYGPTPGVTTTSGVGGNLLVPTGPNSTYLPNGTLNEWDAPMPPAQVSFSIGSGPGYLSEVNKTGLYSLTFDTGSIPSAGCPTGYTANTSTGTCQIVVNPDPFYSEAIPASPLIPPVMNNGGYLWDSWNFTSGAFGTSTATTTAAGIVNGISTTVSLASDICPTGFTDTGADCTTTSLSVDQCGRETGSYGNFDSTTGTCTVPYIPANTTAEPSYFGGMVLSEFCLTQTETNNTGSGTVTIADGTGFYVGEPIQILAGGSDYYEGRSLFIDSITAASVPGLPNAVTLTISDPYFDGGFDCYQPEGTDGVPGDGALIVGDDFGFPVGSTTASQIGPNAAITLVDPSDGTAYTEDVTHVNTTTGVVYVDDQERVAEVLTHYSCDDANGENDTVYVADADPTCLPDAIAPAGTTFSYTNAGAGAAINGTVPNPYPFWQWVSGQNGSYPNAATVYSDNHGEAVVALSTSVTSSTVAPSSAGTCPSGTTPVSNGGVVTTCLVNFTTLGAAGFQNLSSTTLKSITSGGCLATFPSGTTAVIPNGSGSIIPATGPGAGQICINALGGIEFGTGAVLGTTSVNAIADYPYTRGVHPAVASPGLTKVWTSQFVKSLSVSAGTPGPANTTSYTVTITAKDLCGNPITNEPVQVYALSGSGTGAVLAPVSGGIILSSNGNSATVTPDHTGIATLSLEVLNTAIGTGGLVIKAVWPYERVERFVTVISGTSGQSASVVYPPGWQQVGGPPGSNFSTAEALFSWDPATSTYSDVTSSDAAVSSAPPACSGYWAYFAAAMTVSLQPTSKSGDTATCNLAAGWNLVGNPFGTPAILPSGTVAYHWNGTSYDATNQIPLGGSDWVYMAAAGTLTITAS